MIKIEVRADHEPETMFGTIGVDSYGELGEKITFDLISPPQWLSGDTPTPEKLQLEWGNYCPDGVTVYPALKSKPNDIDKLRRIPGFIEGGRV